MHTHDPMVYSGPLREQEEGTLMTLVHSDLPNTKGGRGHEDGWKLLPKYFT